MCEEEVLLMKFKKIEIKNYKGIENEIKIYKF